MYDIVVKGKGSKSEFVFARVVERLVPLYMERAKRAFPRLEVYYRKYVPAVKRG
jgi:hypothetical protein